MAPPRKVRVPHAQGCPATPERMERYEATRPDATTTMVTRCNECGAMAYSDQAALVAVGTDDEEMT